MNNKKSNYLALAIWLILVSFYFYQFIGRSSFITVLTNELMSYFHVDAAGMGILGSCYYLIYTLMQIPAGIIVDRHSLRNTATLAVLICTVGLYLLVATDNFYIAAFAEMLLGFGSAFSFLLAIKSITSWFPANKITIMTSYTMSVGCLGPVIGGPGVAYIVKYFQWQDVIKSYCLFGLLLTVLVWIIVKDKKEEKIEHSDDELNLLHSLKTIISSKQAWVLALMTMALYSPLSALGDLWGVSFIKVAYGLNAEMSALVNNMLYLGVVIGSPLVAYIATICNSYKKPILTAMITAFISLSFIVYGSAYLNVPMLFILFFLTGVSCGAMLSYPLALSLFPKSIGATVTGFINMMSMVSGIILMPTIGLIIKHVWDGKIVDGIEIYQLSDYQYGLLSVILFLAFGIIISLFIKDRSPKGE